MNKYTKDWLIAEYDFKKDQYNIWYEDKNCKMLYWAMPKDYIEKYWEEVKEEDIFDKVLNELRYDYWWSIETEYSQNQFKQILQKYFKDESEEFVNFLKKNCKSKTKMNDKCIIIHELKPLIRDYLIIKKI